MMGSQVTMVDFYAYYIVMNERIISNKVLGWDILYEVEVMRYIMRMMYDLTSIKLIDEQRNIAIAKMMDNL
jgi:glutathione S-transferase